MKCSVIFPNKMKSEFKKLNNYFWRYTSKLNLSLHYLLVWQSKILKKPFKRLFKEID